MDVQQIYDDLFVRAERVAKDGQEHAMILCTFTPKGEMHSVMLLNGDKDGIAEVLNKVVRGVPQMWTVAHISEVWMRFAELGKEIDHETPVKDQPGAYEAVAFMFFREGAIWTARCKVDHKAHTLEKGPLTKVKVGDIEGRFVPLHVR